MKNILTTTALLWPLLTSVIALPSPAFPQSLDDPKHISSVFGSTSPRQVSARFETPCQGCSIGTDNGLIFDLTVARAEGNCESIPPLVNGVRLTDSWRRGLRGTGRKQIRGGGHGVLSTNLANGLGQREIFASWETLCIPEQAQLLSFTVHQIGQDAVTEPAGFTASFKQRGQPEILRLSGEPTDLESQDANILDSWITPPLSLRPSVDDILEEYWRQLVELEAENHKLAVAVHDKKKEIKHIIKQDFKSVIDSCPGIKCVVQTTLQKVPMIIHLIVDHFHHSKPLSSTLYKQNEPSTSLKWADSANETRSLDEEHEKSGVDMFYDPSASHDELDIPPPPPGSHPPAPPLPAMSPTPPSPPAPPSDPTPPPGDGRHGFHRPPPYPLHFPPHHHPIPQHHHHHSHKILKRIVSILVLATLASLLFRHLRHNSTLFRCCPRSADRACRREERRNRRAHRRAALQHSWSTWWNRYRRPTTTADYDEKRTLILEQEGILEDAMQDELRALRSAHQIVEEMYDAEEGRSRLYRAVNRPGSAFASPAELPGGRSTSGSHTSSSSSSTGGERGRSDSTPLSLYRSPSMYSLPPPQYEEELEGDLTVVDGFRYTPSSSSADLDTPDSSVIDCSPRMSSDTARTALTREEDDDRN